MQPLILIRSRGGQVDLIGRTVLSSHEAESKILCNPPCQTKRQHNEMYPPDPHHPFRWISNLVLRRKTMGKKGLKCRGAGGGRISTCRWEEGTYPPSSDRPHDRSLIYFNAGDSGKNGEDWQFVALREKRGQSYLCTPSDPPLPTIACERGRMMDHQKSGSGVQNCVDCPRICPQAGCNECFIARQYRRKIPPFMRKIP